MIKLKKSTQNILLKFLFLILLIVIYQAYNYYFPSVQEEGVTTTELRETNTTNEEKKENTTEEEKKTEPIIQVTEKSNFQIYFIDVGQADCILIQNNGEYALIDAGNNADGKKLVKYFTSLGITNFQYVIGTHAHEDHIGGMDDILKNFSVEHFYMPDVVTTTKTFEEILDVLEDKGILFETPDIDATFSMGDTKFTVLFVGQDKEDLNNTSIVLRLTYKNTSYLLTGDATSTVEKEILEKTLESDVLKVGHHGSQYSSSAAFLKAVHPKYAIISVGNNNDYGHPKQVVLDKLERLGTKVYRTDQSGTIILSSDGNEIYIETTKTDTDG